MTNETGHSLGNVLLDEQLIKEDLQVVANYVKDKLFLKCKFVYGKEDLHVNSRIYKDFKKECRQNVGGNRLTAETEEPYLQNLWMEAVKTKVVTDQLNNRRSAVYTVMMNRVGGKCKHQNDQRVFALFTNLTTIYRSM